eukprot:scaffold34482_cov24-Prasinocladus_malaysianus.AAC.2
MAVALIRYKPTTYELVEPLDQPARGAELEGLDVNQLKNAIITQLSFGASQPCTLHVFVSKKGMPRGVVH